MIRLAVRCRPEQAEVVLAELVQLAPGGVEEEAGDGWVEYAIYGAEGELPDLGEVEAAAGEDLVEITSERIPDDWADRWRDFHEPTVLADRRVVIRPAWHDRPSRLPWTSSSTPVRPSAPAHTRRPGCAWTARLACRPGPRERPARRSRDRLRVLAIVAAKLGWSPVLGVDHEAAGTRGGG